MGLGDVYSNNVRKTSIGMSGLAGSMPSARERDPKSIELENNVFAQMQQAVTPDKPTDQQDVQPVINVQSVGLEQAMKELLDSAESFDNKL